MPATAPLDSHLSCADCGHPFHGVCSAGGAGPFMRQLYCRHCRVWWLFVHRVTLKPGHSCELLYLGSVRTRGRDEGSIREALAALPEEITPDEVELLIQVAKLQLRAPAAAPSPRRLFNGHRRRQSARGRVLRNTA